MQSPSSCVFFYQGSAFVSPRGGGGERSGCFLQNTPRPHSKRPGTSFYACKIVAPRVAYTSILTVTVYEVWHHSVRKCETVCTSNDARTVLNFRDTGAEEGATDPSQRMFAYRYYTRRQWSRRYGYYRVEWKCEIVMLDNPGLVVVGSPLLLDSEFP